jgi:hypothetical protein
VLRAAVERDLEHLDSLDEAPRMLPLGDLRAELTFLARWNLSSLEQRSDLLRFLRRTPSASRISPRPCTSA